MKKILIHAISLNSGGGKYILDNLVSQLIKEETTYNFYLIAPEKFVMKKNGINILQVSSFYRKKVGTFFYYNYLIKKIIRNENIDQVWNFGDVIIPNFSSQIYYCDWAYTLYDENYIWKNMPLLDWIKRKLKVININNNIGSIDRVLVQTETMKVRAQRKYGLKDIEVVPTPVKFFQSDKEILFKKIPGVKDFVYVASYSYHKNHGILLEVASKIKEQQLPFRIFLTVDLHLGKEFLKEVKKRNLTKVLVNLGTLSHSQVGSVLSEADATLNPSLLESYGLPYFESMYYSKPIFAADLDFAHEACSEAALYFNPFDSESIVQSMNNILNYKIMDELVKEGTKRISSLPSWADFTNYFK